MKNIAHRGGAGLRPENTLAAFAHASELGADMIEFDLQPTKDFRIIVMHEGRVKGEITDVTNATQEDILSMAIA